MPPPDPSVAAALRLIQCSILVAPAIATDLATGELETGGLFGGVGRLAAALCALADTVPVEGSAWNTPWPVLQHDAGILAPALPVLGRTGECAAEDAVYHGRRGAVLRESAGRVEPFLSWRAERPWTDDPAPLPFHALWFDSGARFVLRDAAVEISDLFACSMVPVRAAQLERLLVRPRRLATATARALIVDTEPRVFPARITVHRPRTLWSHEPPGDPCRFLALQPGIDHVTTIGDLITLRLHSGERVKLRLRLEVGGWRLEHLAGSWPHRVLQLLPLQDTLALSSEPEPALDLLSGAVRARLAFDLSSDLRAFAQNS